MNACIYAILNRRKCDICKVHQRNIFDIPIYCNDLCKVPRLEYLALCNRCLIDLVEDRVFTISLNSKEKR